MKIEEYKQIKKIALLVSCASVLQMVEYLFPQPLPGVKLGLANMITLVTLVNLGFSAAVEVAVLRTIISSFILGTFLSPTFILSFSSALVSTLIMGLFYKLSTFNSKMYLSLIGISLLGAITNNLVQIGLVYLLLIRHKGVFLLLPWLGISAVITGWLTGFIASEVCKKLETSTDKISLPQNTSSQNIYKDGTLLKNSFSLGRYISIDSPVHRVAPYIKIITVLVLSLIVLISNNFLVYATILLLLLGAVHRAKIPFLNLLSDIKKTYSLIFISFLVPVLFNKNGEILLSLGMFNITKEGLVMGSMFVFRIVLMMTSAFLLLKTTSPDELTNDLKKLLVPLRIIGISGERMAEIITLSLTSIPILMEKSHSFIREQKFNKKVFRDFFPAIVGLIVVLYQQSDEQII
ncbi:MAG: Gx transporter family protein [Elusimicrobiota bacterium]|nr:Gx transporter family protein [Elusimicrobiota bacterium]